MGYGLLFDANTASESPGVSVLCFANLLRDHTRASSSSQAYEGLCTVERLREEYLFLPSKVKEVYLHHVLTEVLPASKVRSAILFASTCRGCHLLSLLLEQLGLPAVALHSGEVGKRSCGLEGGKWGCAAR